MKLTLYDTLTRKKKVFTPLKGNEARMYTCGPTVYDYPHIGNLRSYIFADTLKRVLLFNGYNVKHVINITDVGHLSSDADQGEDKLEKGAAREKKTVWDIAQFYTKIFKENIKELNIFPPTIWAKATSHIKEQIELIKRLDEKGYTYQTRQAVYFDITKFPHYTKLSRQALKGQLTGARGEVRIDLQKKHPQDFALWFFRIGRFVNHTMHWPSPWGDGFPGWHIECSAMAMKYLGENFDIHTGGVDHISTHHTNEIAQSEGATGKPFVRFWLHGEFLLVDGKKMSKSAGTFITLENIKKKGLSPLAFRLLLLQAHYRAKLNFTWDSLAASQRALDNVDSIVSNLRIERGKLLNHNPLLDQFKNALHDDLNTPQALAVFFDVLSKIKNGQLDQKEASALLSKMDEVLGLNLERLAPPSIIKIDNTKIHNQTGRELSEHILQLLKKRDEARRNDNWQKADEIRGAISKLGYLIQDSETYTAVKKKK